MKLRVAVAGLAATVLVGGFSVGVDANTTDLRVESPSDTLAAIDVLRAIPIERENPRGYRRSLFNHWLDTDGDGCDAREQVLKRDAIGFAQVDPFRCFVVEADWVSPYDGRRTSDRTEVDIDHVVALKEAWDSGAWQWDEARRTAFANDTSDARTLVAVSSSSNRSKSDKDPSNWLPPLRAYRCTYVSNWIAVKARWSLSMDQSEWRRLDNLLNSECAGTNMRGWNPTTSSPSAGSATSSSTSSTATTASTTSTTSTTAAGTQVASVRPGAFCTPVGSIGRYANRIYVCATSNTSGVPYNDGRARWRRQ